MRNIPQEVVDLMCSHLDSDDGRDLYNCALTSRLFLHPSRRRTTQLRHVKVFSHEQREALSCHLHHPLSTLRAHIRSIVVSDEDVGYPSYAWSIVDFTDTLSLCMNLAKIDLEYVELRPTDLPTMNNVITLRLSSVEFTTAQHIVDFLSRFPNLQSLKLRNVAYRVVEPAHNAALPADLRAVEIEFDAVYDPVFGRAQDQLLKWMAQTDSALPGIERLNIYNIGPRDVLAFRETLLRLSSTIHHISVTVANDLMDVDDMLLDRGIFDRASTWYRNASGIGCIFHPDISRSPSSG